MTYTGSVAVAARVVEAQEAPIALGPYRAGDYQRLPDEVRCELVYGSFSMSPSPTVTHQLVALLLWRHFFAIAQRVGGFAASAPLDVLLADHSVVQPDVLYVTPARRGILRERVEGAPDLVVEVLSPASARQDRDQKLKLYAESNVQEYWLVDSAARRFEFMIARDGRFEAVPPNKGLYRSPVLPEIQLDLAAFWREVEASLRG